MRASGEAVVALNFSSACADLKVGATQTVTYGGSEVAWTCSCPPLFVVTGGRTADLQNRSDAVIDTLPTRAPSWVPRHYLTSFIGRLSWKDEFMFRVPTETQRFPLRHPARSSAEVTPHPRDKQNVGPPARDGW